MGHLPGHTPTTSWLQDTGYKLQNAVYKPAGYKDAKDAKVQQRMQDTGCIGYSIQDTG